VLYIVLGTLYNFLVLDLRGLDAIPRYSLVSLRDTVAFFRKWYARFADRSAGGGYYGGRRSNTSGHYRGLGDEEEGMLSGPPGFLDEQDDEEEQPNRGPRTGMDPSGVIRL
jgi:cation-dependent mannose-6-phosphate receptor